MRLSASDRNMIDRDVSTNAEREILEELRRRKYPQYSRLFQLSRGDFLYAVMRRRFQGSIIGVIGATSIAWATKEVERLRKEEVAEIAHDVAVNWSCGRGI